MVGGDFAGFAELLVSMQEALDRTELNVPPPLSPALETFSPPHGTLVIDGSNEINKKVTNCLTSAKDDYSWGSLDSSNTTIRQELSNSICSSSEFFPNMMQAALSTLSAAPAAPLPLSSSSPVKCVPGPPSIPIQPPLFRSLSGSHHRHLESNASKHALPTAICLGNSIYRPGEHALTVISLQTTRGSTATAEMNIGDASFVAKLLNKREDQAAASQAPYGLEHTGCLSTKQDDELSKLETATIMTKAMTMPPVEPLQLPPITPGTLPPKGLRDYTLSRATSTPTESTAKTNENQGLSSRNMPNIPSRSGSPDLDGPRPSVSQSSTPRVLTYTPCGVPRSLDTPSSSERIQKLSFPSSSQCPHPLEPVLKTTTAYTPCPTTSQVLTPRVIPHAPRLLKCPAKSPFRCIQTTRPVPPLLTMSGASVRCTDEIREIKAGAQHIAVYTADRPAMAAMQNGGDNASPVFSALDPSGSSTLRKTNMSIDASMAGIDFRGESQGGGWV